MAGEQPPGDPVPHRQCAGCGTGYPGVWASCPHCKSTEVQEPAEPAGED